jgi:hypothetical protein
MEQSWLLENSERIGVVGLLAFNVVALLQGWVVTGREYRSAKSECEALRKGLDAANARDLLRLERAEQALATLNHRN